MISISKEEKKKVSGCASKLGVDLNNPLYLNQALIHRSYANETEHTGWHNERLEFLGDSVLGFVMTLLLYNLFPQASEGELTLYKSELVSTKTLAVIANGFELQQYIHLGKGERSRKENIPVSIMASAYEAVIGAVFLDSGYKKTVTMIKKHFDPYIQQVTSLKKQDSKSYLQEYLHKTCKVSPSYRVVKTEGPAHNRIFYVEVVDKTRVIGEGAGRSKREAEQLAARAAIANLKR